MAINFDTNDVGDLDTTPSPDRVVKDLVLAYVVFGQDSAGGWSGALMLTDSRTRPIHFGFATPIRPAKLQRLLYGNTLDEYVKIDIIAKRLLQEVPRAPHAIFVESSDLLSLRRITEYPIGFLSRSEGQQNGDSNASTAQVSTGDNYEDYDRVAPILSELDTSVDVLDPFARMKEALKEALQEAAKQGRPSSTNDAK
jgi:hypothetical protein